MVRENLHEILARVFRGEGASINLSVLNRPDNAVQPGEIEVGNLTDQLPLQQLYAQIMAHLESLNEFAAPLIEKQEQRQQIDPAEREEYEYRKKTFDQLQQVFSLLLSVFGGMKYEGREVRIRANWVLAVPPAPTCPMCGRAHCIGHQLLREIFPGFGG